MAEDRHPTWDTYREHMCDHDPASLEEFYGQMDPLHEMGVWPAPRAVSFDLPKIGAMKQKTIGWKFWLPGTHQLMVWVDERQQRKGLVSKAMSDARYEERLRWTERFDRR